MVIAIGCLALPTPGRVDPRLAKCSTLTDLLTSMIRTNDMERARRFKSRLETCIRLQRAAVERDARRIVQQGPK